MKKGRCFARRSKPSSETKYTFLNFPESSSIHAILAWNNVLILVFGAKT